MIGVPGNDDDNENMTSADAEKALRDLMGGGMNVEADVEIDMEDAVVKGFREGITLLPHQIIGRAWMRDREDSTKKRTGGILADDMGLVFLCQYSGMRSDFLCLKSWQNDPDPHTDC